MHVVCKLPWIWEIPLDRKALVKVGKFMSLRPLGIVKSPQIPSLVRFGTALHPLTTHQHFISSGGFLAGKSYICKESGMAAISCCLSSNHILASFQLPGNIYNLRFGVILAG